MINLLEDSESLKELYYGNIEKNQRNGFGVQPFLNGDIYIGKWKNDKPHGLGNLILNCGVKIKGKFSQSKLKRIEINYLDFLRFEGNLDQGEKFLKGFFFIDDDVRVKIWWKNGKIDKAAFISKEKKKEYIYDSKFSNSDFEEGYEKDGIKETPNYVKLKRKNFHLKINKNDENEFCYYSVKDFNKDGRAIKIYSPFHFEIISYKDNFKKKIKEINLKKKIEKNYLLDLNTCKTPVSINNVNGIKIKFNKENKKIEKIFFCFFSKFEIGLKLKNKNYDYCSEKKFIFKNVELIKRKNGRDEREFFENFKSLFDTQKFSEYIHFKYLFKKILEKKNIKRIFKKFFLNEYKEYKNNFIEYIPELKYTINDLKITSEEFVNQSVNSEKEKNIEDFLKNISDFEKIKEKDSKKNKKENILYLKKDDNLQKTNKENCLNKKHFSNIFEKEKEKNLKQNIDQENNKSDSFNFSNINNEYDKISEESIIQKQNVFSNQNTKFIKSNIIENSENKKNVYYQEKNFFNTNGKNGKNLYYLKEIEKEKNLNKNENNSNYETNEKIYDKKNEINFKKSIRENNYEYSKKKKKFERDQNLNEKNNEIKKNIDIYNLKINPNKKNFQINKNEKEFDHHKISNNYNKNKEKNGKNLCSQNQNNQKNCKNIIINNENNFEIIRKNKKDDLKNTFKNYSLKKKNNFNREDFLNKKNNFEKIYFSDLENEEISTIKTVKLKLKENLKKNNFFDFEIFLRKKNNEKKEKLNCDFIEGMIIKDLIEGYSSLKKKKKIKQKEFSKKEKKMDYFINKRIIKKF